MRQAVLRRSLFLLLLACYFAINAAGNLEAVKPEDVRAKRASHKPGFFRTLFSVIGEQYTDTKDTFGKVNNLINDNFLPENAPVTEATTPKDTNNASTTMAPYLITRTEFNKILRRNLKGLVRLFNIEFRDAIQQSKVTQAEYKTNVSKEVSKFL